MLGRLVPDSARLQGELTFSRRSKVTQGGNVGIPLGVETWPPGPGFIVVT